MAEDPTKDSKSGQKMVPEKDLIALKERDKKARAELEEAKGKVAQLESELKIAKVDSEDDEEVKNIKKYLLDEDKKIKGERAKLDEDLASFNERAKESQVKALIEKYGVTEEQLQGVDDPEKEALRLYAERLAEEKPPGSVFESGGGGVAKTAVWDKSEEEFEKDWNKQKREALSK